MRINISSSISISGRIFSFFQLAKTSRAAIYKVASSITTFSYNLVLANLFGASGVGTYFLAIAIIEILGTASRLGMESTILRHATVKIDGKSFASAYSLYKKSIRLCIFSGLTVSALTIAFFYLYKNHSDQAAHLRDIIPVMVLGLPFTAILLIHCEFIKASNRQDVAMFFKTLLQPATLAIITLALYLVNSRSLKEVAYLHLLSSVFAAILIAKYWRSISQFPKKPRSEFRTGAILRESFPMLVLSLLGVLQGWSDIIILSIWYGHETIGVYSACVKISAVVTLMLTALNSIYSREFALHNSNQDYKGIEKTAQKFIVILLFSSIPIVICLLLYPAFFLNMFGAEFISGENALRILVAGQLVNLLSGPVGCILIMTGNSYTLSKVMLLSVAINVSLNFALSPTFGDVGAASATALSLAGANLLSYIIVSRKFHIKLFRVV